MSKYVDTPSLIQVLGNLYMNPLLFEDDRYHFSVEDFTEDFHKVIFGVLNNMHELGVKEITLSSIEDYLAERPKALATYQVHDGANWIAKTAQAVQPAAFNYYYQKMKKMTLLRMYNSIGLDVSDLYDIDNVLDLKKKQTQEDWLDNTSLEDIALVIDNKVSKVKEKYVDNLTNDFIQAGDGAKELMQRLKREPAVGVPLYGPFFNGVLRGARLGKFYLRSAATGVGKTRSMIADACFIACDEIYNKDKGAWVRNGTKEPTIYITTEQDEEEVQTMMQAFLANVPEGHIIDGKYEGDEEERVLYACDILSRCPLYIKKLPDFSLQDIEATLKAGIREFDAKYIFFDYIHTSMKILSEISSKAGVKNLREDNILFMISVRLKDLCVENDVFIMSATQLNADYRESDTPDQNCLRGAKAIADKIDAGLLMMEVMKKDREALKEFLESNNIEMPDIKISVYKNRRGQHKGIYLWCKADRGTCRIIPYFATTWEYEVVKIEDFKINVV